MKAQGTITQTLIRLLMICLLDPASVALAGEAPSDAATTSSASPLTAHSKEVYSGVKLILLRAAESMPEESYAFKPVDSVRSFGQIAGHAAERGQPRQTCDQARATHPPGEPVAYLTRGPNG